jgi:hypothetical protein
MAGRPGRQEQLADWELTDAQPADSPATASSYRSRAPFDDKVCTIIKLTGEQSAHLVADLHPSARPAAGITRHSLPCLVSSSDEAPRRVGQSARLVHIPDDNGAVLPTCRYPKHPIRRSERTQAANGRPSARCRQKTSTGQSAAWNSTSPPVAQERARACETVHLRCRSLVRRPIASYSLSRRSSIRTVPVIRSHTVRPPLLRPVAMR